MIRELHKVAFLFAIHYLSYPASTLSVAHILVKTPPKDQPPGSRALPRRRGQTIQPKNLKRTLFRGPCPVFFSFEIPMLKVLLFS